MPVFQSGARCLRRLSEYLMGLHCFRTSVPTYLVPIVPCSVCRFSIRVSSTACDDVLRLAAISLLWTSGGRLSSYRYLVVLARRSMRSVGSLSGLDSRASVGKWSNCVRMRRVWEWARYPRSVSLFIALMRCSIPIWVALSLTDGRPRTISFGGR